jgi:hypothetical protein
MGKKYVINLMELGPLGIKQIDDYRNHEKTTGEIVGIAPQDLAVDISLLDSVTVTRS